MRPYRKLLTLILAMSSIYVSGQLPNMRSLYKYALYTKTGAFGNTDSSTIYGDIGTHAGALTGFPPGNLVGDSHVADSNTLQAGIDLDSSKAFLTRMTCDSVIGVGLGDSQVLGPNVYCIGAATTLSGTLILNAAGDSNSLFVFKIDGAFAAYAKSKIILVNEAKISHVFWVINGAFTLMDSAEFAGTVINNGSIDLDYKSIIIGRVLSVAGAISVYNGIVDGMMTLNNVFPIHLNHLGVIGTGSHSATIYWSTLSEHGSRFFAIERSYNGDAFEEIIQMEAAGESLILKEYQYNDDALVPEETYYYRLKMVDIDDSYDFSEVVKLKSHQIDGQVYLFPNPANNFLQINFASTRNESNFLEIINNQGVVVLIKPVNKPMNTIDVSRLSEGIYWYRLVLQSGEMNSNRFVIMR